MYPKITKQKIRVFITSSSILVYGQNNLLNFISKLLPLKWKSN